MKTKSKIISSFILGAFILAATGVCLGTQLSAQDDEPFFKGVYDNTIVAFADEGASTGEDAPKSEVGEIRGMISVKKNYLLLATALYIEDAADYNAIGYEISENGGEAKSYSSDTYYKGICVKTGAGSTRTYTLKDIFGADTTAMGMIVTEIDYETITDYEIKPYVVSNTEGNRYGTAQTLKATEEAYYLTLTGATVTLANEKANPTPVTTSGEGDTAVNKYAFAKGTEITVQAAENPSGKMFVGFDADGVADNRVGEEGVPVYNFAMPAEDDAFAAVFHAADTTFFSTGTFQSGSEYTPEGMTATKIDNPIDEDLEGLSGFSFSIPANTTANQQLVRNISGVNLSTWGIDQSKLAKFILKNHSDVAVTVEIAAEYWGAYSTTGKITVPANSVVTHCATLEVFLGRYDKTDMSIHVRENMTGNAGERVQLDVVASVAKKYAEKPSDLIATGGKYMQYGDDGKGVEDGSNAVAQNSGMDLVRYDTYGAMYFYGNRAYSTRYASVRADQLGDEKIVLPYNYDSTKNDTKTYTMYVKVTNLNMDMKRSYMDLVFTCYDKTLQNASYNLATYPIPTLGSTNSVNEAVFKVEFTVKGQEARTMYMGLLNKNDDDKNGNFNILIQIATTNIFGDLTASPSHRHIPTYVAEKAAGYAVHGNIAHYRCDCGAYFLEQGGEEVPRSEVIIRSRTQFDKKTYSKHGYTLNYCLYEPESLNKTEDKVPLILFLHGAGERGYDNEAQLKNAILEVVKEGNEDSAWMNSVILAPQCPTDDDPATWVSDVNDPNKWVETPWNVVPHANYVQANVAESKPLKAAAELVHQYAAYDYIDEDRVYVVGLSMGGFGTWDILARYPDLFAAGAPICGGGPSDKVDTLKNIPIYTFHGTVDSAVQYAGTQAMYTDIKAAGGDKILFYTFEGRGHNIWNKAIAFAGDGAQYPALETWLFSQHK